MTPHTPTIFASVALVAVTMAVCLIIVGRFRLRDGLSTVGCGLMAHAAAYVCYTLYGHVSLWFSYALANSLLSLAMALYSASLFRIREMKVPWLACLLWPAMMIISMTLLIGETAPRMLTSSLLLAVQCVLLVYWSWRHAEVNGRAYQLLMFGGLVSLVSLLIRVVAILSGADMDMRYDMSNVKQTVSVSIGTATVMMLSFGLVLLARERSEHAIRQMALHDALTGLLNRRAVLEQLDQEIERARRNEDPLALVMIDVDHFKAINDRYGHLVGDTVLRHCATQLSARLRKLDRLGRYGGEEFLLLLPNTHIAGALQLVDELRHQVAMQPVNCQEQDIPVTFSAGLWCAQPESGDTADSLIAKADEALYRAKEGGRNRVVLWHPGEAVTSC